ncbi:olfactory receptor 2T34-like [Acanthaster planci]|uniref:Olfactory receptor 2T34-like n=1 Tax=Acanthaster planci TaxID=133434 RepID=A0A8B7YF30_ACAPL|nr:olfactory receptor 2T34-like [Acanthaster planci]
MHSIIYIYLVNLAAADASFLVLALSKIWLWRQTITSEILSSAHLTCRFTTYSFVTALAFDRFFAVTKPLHFRVRATKTRATKISTGLWAFTLSLGVSHFILGYFESYTKLVCSAVKLAVHTTILSVNAVLYTSIVRAARPASTKLNCTSSIRVDRILRIVILNTAVFFLYTLLVVVSSAMTLVSEISDHLNPISQTHLTHLNQMVSVLYLINCSIDPIIYSVANADRQAAFVEAFSCLDFCRYHRNALTAQSQSDKQIRMQQPRPLPEAGHDLAGRRQAQSQRLVQDPTSSHTSASLNIEDLPSTSQRPVCLSKFEPLIHLQMKSSATTSSIGRNETPILSVTSKGSFSVMEPSTADATHNKQSSSSWESGWQDEEPGETLEDCTWL